VKAGHRLCSCINGSARGNLSQKSLLNIIKKGDVVEDSEFLETLLVAVPK
jgi:hypothetical protein